MEDKTSSTDSAKVNQQQTSSTAAQGGAAQATQSPGSVGDKSYLVAWLLSYFLGVFGADRFYLGYTGLGIAKLLTFGGCGIWALIDWIMIFAGVTKDSQGRLLAERDKYFKTTVIILVVMLIVGAISGIANAMMFQGVKSGLNSY